MNICTFICHGQCLFRVENGSVDTPFLSSTCAHVCKLTTCKCFKEEKEDKPKYSLIAINTLSCFQILLILKTFPILKFTRALFEISFTPLQQLLCIFSRLKTNLSRSVSSNMSLTFTPAFMSRITTVLRGFQMFLQKAGKKIDTQFDTMQSHVLCLSLSSICINLTFSNLALPFPVSNRTAVPCWLGCLQRACTEKVKPIKGHLGCISH